MKPFRAPAALGALERQVMEHLWRAGREASVRDVHEAFAPSLAYTTLMTTLDRLHKKGLLRRRKEGRAFVYAPSVSPEQLHQLLEELARLVSEKRRQLEEEI
jgi:predicted transcriptional regulator